MAFDYDVNVRPISNPQGKTVAYAQLVIDNQIQIDGFKIINGSTGLFVSAPQHKGKDKEGADSWFDDVRFLGQKPEGVHRTPLQDEIYKAMITKFQQVSVSQSRGGAAAAQAHNQNPMTTSNHRLWPS